MSSTVDLNADLGEGFGVWRLGDDEALLGEAVRSLPHDPALERTTMERVQAGWVRIYERTVG